MGTPRDPASGADVPSHGGRQASRETPSLRREVTVPPVGPVTWRGRREDRTPVRLRRIRLRHRIPYGMQKLSVSAAPPLVKARTGFVVHRVKAGGYIFRKWKGTAWELIFISWCGQHFYDRARLMDDALETCVRCEQHATRAGEPTISEIVGHPVDPHVPAVYRRRT